MCGKIVDGCCAELRGMLVRAGRVRLYITLWYMHIPLEQTLERARTMTGMYRTYMDPVATPPIYLDWRL